LGKNSRPLQQLVREILVLLRIMQAHKDS